MATTVKRHRETEMVGRTLSAQMATLIWFIFCVIGGALIVGGLAANNLVNGFNVRTGREATVGFFEECVGSGDDEDCDDIDISDEQSSVWQASAAFFIIGLIFLIVTCILICVFACMTRHPLSVALWAKALMLVSVVCLIVALVLIPFGFSSLDDPCEEDDQKQCGLQCAQSDGDMEFFILCAPYELGASAFLLFAGEVLVFIGSFFAACVGVRYVIEEEIIY